MVGIIDDVHCYSKIDFLLMILEVDMFQQICLGNSGSSGVCVCMCVSGGGCAYVSVSTDSSYAKLCIGNQLSSSCSRTGCK